MMNKLNERDVGLLIGAICALIIMLTGIKADADEMSETSIKTERVALFKNGLGYFSSSATLPKGATDIKISELPVPSHGTFWVAYPEDVKFHALFTSMEDVETTMTPHNVAELLLGNLEQKVTIKANIPDMKEIKGTVVEVIREDKPIEQPNTYYRNVRSSIPANRYQPHQPPALVIIKTESGNVAINAELIIRVDFEEDSIVTSVPAASQKPSMRIELEKAANGQNIAVSFLARGITWSPSYLIDISDPAKAKLSAKAVIINEAADLENIHLDLVTGFPNILFGEVSSPIAMSQDLAGFLKALATGRSGTATPSSPMLSNTMTTQVAYGYSTMADKYTLRAEPEYSAAQEGIVTEDLYYYPVENFSLKRGETACLPLFTAEVPYKHIYIWNIPDRLEEDERYGRNKPEDKDILAEEVWHSCRLVNEMEMPWTTAAAEFVKDGQVAGQDICYYTPPGAETTIRLNRALNVQAEVAEMELERQRNVEHFYGYSYDLVKVKGEMKLQNRLDKTINVEITKNLSGEVLGTVPEAEDTRTAKGLKRVNTRHVLKWEVELQPGQEKNMSYTYKVYVRN